MAQLVIAAAGAAVGSVFGPLGTSVGWALGSVIGSQFGPKQNTQGPRLADLKVISGQYGDVIPWIKGHPRLPAQIWWASDRIEVSQTTEQGKGGGATSTSYTYKVHLFIGLADVPIVDVSRVWLNGKLVYVTLDAASEDSVENSIDNPNWDALTVYTGAPDQLPPPIYEAAVGVGNAPAYRGRGGVFIEGLQLGSSGVIPNLTFEVANVQGDVTSPVLLNSVFTEELVDNSCDSLGEAELGAVDPDGSFSEDGYTINQDQDAAGSVIKGFGWQDDRLLMHDERETTVELLFEVGASTYLVGATDIGFVLMTIGPNVSISSYAYYWYVDPFAETIEIYVAGTGGFTVGGMTRGTRHHIAMCFPAASSGDATRFYFNGSLITTRPNKSPLTETVDAIGIGGFSPSVPILTSTLVTYYGVRVTRDILYPNGTAFTPPTTFDPPICVPSTSVVDATLKETVEGLLARCEIAESGAWDYDATALASITKPVRAIAVSQVVPTRTVLEQLQSAYYFDWYGTDKLYAVPRGGAIVQTIDFDDLATGQEDAEPEALPMNVGSNDEIPAQISVTYANVDADYNTDTQISDRLLTGQVNTSPLQIPMAFSASEAKGIADAIVLDGYASRVSGSFALPLSYAELVPTDVVTAPDEDGNTYRVRIVRRTDERNVLKFEWVLDDPTALESAGITSTDYTPVIDVALPGTSAMELLDIPLLRDADNALGHYVAATSSSGSTWPGASIQRSLSDVEYSEVAVVGERAVMGAATTALPSFAGGVVWDETSTVTVNVGGGELSSSTRSAMHADASINNMAIGSEIVRFRTASMLSPGIYTLSGLLRGQRGTEWAMSTHAIGEPAVLLRPQGLRYVTIDLSSVGVDRYYKGVTRGRPLSSASSEAFVCNGVSMKPLSPVNLRAHVDESGRISVTWHRRTRLASTFVGPSGSVVPLGETVEAYLVELLDSDDSVVQSRTVGEESAELLSTSAVFDLDAPAHYLFDIGGTLFGARFGATPSAAPSLWRFTAADGSVIGGGATLGLQVWDAAVSGANYYAAVGMGISSAGRVYRIDTATPGAVAATYTAPLALDAAGLVHDGSDLWVALQQSGELKRLDDSALTVSDTYSYPGGPCSLAFDGTSLWMTLRDSDEVVEVDPSDGSEIQRFSVVFYPTNIVVVGSIVFVGGATQAASYTDTGTLIEAVDSTGSPSNRTVLEWGDYVAVSDATNGVVRLLDSSTGASDGTIPVESLWHLAGATDDSLFVAAGVTSPPSVTHAYASAGDLSGMTVRVRQISTVVGNGYPATVDLS